MTEIEELKEKVSIATKAVEGLPDDLKTEGFKIILNNLLEEQRKAFKKSKQSFFKIKEPSEDADKIIKSLNKSAYRGIHLLTKTLDKALFILKIVKDDAGEDGLTPSQICDILSDKFRIKVTNAAVGMALGGASSPYVNRIKVAVRGAPPAYKYRIMHEGEVYLERILKKELETEAVDNGN